MAVHWILTLLRTKGLACQTTSCVRTHAGYVHNWRMLGYLSRTYVEISVYISLTSIQLIHTYCLKSVTFEFYSHRITYGDAYIVHHRA